MQQPVMQSYDIVYSGIQAQSLVVTSLPAVLFQTNGGVHNITAGSVIQLYCSVQSTTASFSWTKDGPFLLPLKGPGNEAKYLRATIICGYKS